MERTTSRILLGDAPKHKKRALQVSERAQIQQVAHESAKFDGPVSEMSCIESLIICVIPLFDIKCEEISRL
jgi:hypothetical protein